MTITYLENKGHANPGNLFPRWLCQIHAATTYGASGRTREEAIQNVTNLMNRKTK